MGRIYNISTARLALGALLLISGLFHSPLVYGDELLQRSLLLSDAGAGATSTYKLDFTISSPVTVGSIEIQFCANDPLFSDPCTIPTGLNTSTAVLGEQTGVNGFSISSTGTSTNTLVLSHIPSTIMAAEAVSFTLTGIINPSSDGSYYGRVQTFASMDRNGPENDLGGLAFSIDSALQISATVPPYLLFCGGATIPGLNCSAASGDYIRFGDFNSAITSSAQSQLLAATNAPGGYQIEIYGSTMASGNNIISAMSTRNVSKLDTSEFGLNLVANQTPAIGEDPQGPGNVLPMNAYSQPNWYQFNSGDTLVRVMSADSYKKFTVSYMVNVSSNQIPGVYVATLTYVCLASF